MNLTDVKFMLNVQWGWGGGGESEGHINKKNPKNPNLALFQSCTVWTVCDIVCWGERGCSM